MNLEEAITVALEYEGRVYKTYLETQHEAVDDVGRRVFNTLCEEEKGHIDYLNARLEEWRRDGTITIEELDSVFPSKLAIDTAVARLRDKVGGGSGTSRQGELELLRRALKVEGETSAFYREMVSTLDDEGKRLFARFVEIEEGHQAIVQAEIDCLSGSGFWFDTAEFDLELG